MLPIPCGRLIQSAATNGGRLFCEGQVFCEHCVAIRKLLAACKAVSAKASEVHLFALQSPSPTESQMYAGMVGAAGAFKSMVDDVIFEVEH